MVVFDSPSIYEIMTELIGLPANDAERFLIFFASMAIGIFVFFTVIFMITTPFRMLNAYFK